MSSNYLTDASGKKLAYGLQFNESLKSLVLKNNSLGDKSAAEFLEGVKIHPAIKRLDLSNNLVNLKYVDKMSVYLVANSNKVDITFLPTLYKQYRHEKALKQKGNLEEVLEQIEQTKKLKKAVLQGCEEVKRKFWKEYKVETQTY